MMEEFGLQVLRVAMDEELRGKLWFTIVMSFLVFMFFTVTRPVKCPKCDFKHLVDEDEGKYSMCPNCNFHRRNY